MKNMMLARVNQIPINHSQSSLFSIQSTLVMMIRWMNDFVSRMESNFSLNSSQPSAQLSLSLSLAFSRQVGWKITSNVIIRIERSVPNQNTISNMRMRNEMRAKEIKKKQCSVEKIDSSNLDLEGSSRSVIAQIANFTSKSSRNEFHIER